VTELAATTPSPLVLRAAIEHALERHAERTSQHVHVAIADGTVTLSGHVPTLAEREAVEGAVRGAPGVRHLDNQLSID